jgi:hypothetical protein
MRRAPLLIPLMLVLAAVPATTAAARSKHHARHRASAAVTKAQVIELIKQYAPGAVAGSQGAHGATGATGPAGPTTAFSAGNGLTLNGTQFSLNPSSTLFQDPLAAPQCPAYTFFYRIDQGGSSLCDYGAVAFTGDSSVVPLGGSATYVMSTTAWNSSSVLVTGQVQLEGGASASSLDVIQCLVYNGSTAFDAIEGELPTAIYGLNPYADLAFTGVQTGVTPGTVFTVKCLILGGTEPAWAETSTIAVLPFS